MNNEPEEIDDGPLQETFLELDAAERKYNDPKYRPLYTPYNLKGLIKKVKEQDLNKPKPANPLTKFFNWLWRK